MVVKENSAISSISDHRHLQIYGRKKAVKIFVLLAVSRTLVQTSTPTALKKKRRLTKPSARRSSCRTASSPATLWCLLMLSWVTASTTCVNTTACSQHSATTSRLTLRPVRAQESLSAGGTAHSVVSDQSLNVKNIQR